MRRTEVRMSSCRFWVFLVSLRLAGSVDSMPMNTQPKWASRNSCSRSLVLSHVERGFGAEAESVIVLVLIFLEEGEKLLSNRQVSNQIVIHEEGIADLEAAQLVQFETHLLQALNARLANAHDDDVAELATKRATARELQRDVAVALELQEVEARRRGVGEGHHSGLVVWWFGA